MSLSTHVAFKSLSLFLALDSLTIMCQVSNIFEFILLGVFEFLGCASHVFYPIWEVFAIVSSNILSAFFSLCSFSVSLIVWMLIHITASPRHLRLCLLFLHSFFSLRLDNVYWLIVEYTYSFLSQLKYAIELLLWLFLISVNACLSLFGLLYQIYHRLCGL